MCIRRALEHRYNLASMYTPRRRFLGSSLVLLGSALTDALATPLWRWQRALTVEAAETKPGNLGVRYVDVAQSAGLISDRLSRLRGVG